VLERSVRGGYGPRPSWRCIWQGDPSGLLRRGRRYEVLAWHQCDGFGGNVGQYDAWDRLVVQGLCSWPGFSLNGSFLVFGSGSGWINFMRLFAYVLTLGQVQGSSGWGDGDRRRMIGLVP